MSLIQQRRQRKKSWLDAKKGMQPWRLVMLLVIVLGMIWYLSWRF